MIQICSSRLLIDKYNPCTIIGLSRRQDIHIDVIIYTDLYISIVCCYIHYSVLILFVYVERARLIPTYRLVHSTVTVNSHRHIFRLFTDTMYVLKSEILQRSSGPRLPASGKPSKAMYDLRDT